MREIHAAEIIDRVAQMCQDANFELGDDVLRALEEATNNETKPLARYVLQQMRENADLARAERVAICQDCGTAVFFVEIGQDVHVVGGDISDAVNEGVRRGYDHGFLRKSMVAGPLKRINTGDNTPAIIHFEIVPGDKLKIIFAPKGAGSENMSALRMLKPADEVEGIKQFVLDTVVKAGPNPCPPVTVGVGIGGNFEKAAIMAKKALMRPIGQHNPNNEIAALETELLERVNFLGIGPAGFGGTTTALAVNIEAYPCHIGSLPVAVNMQCHAARHKEVVI